MANLGDPLGRSEFDPNLTWIGPSSRFPGIGWDGVSSPRRSRDKPRSRGLRCSTSMGMSCSVALGKCSAAVGTFVSRVVADGAPISLLDQGNDLLASSRGSAGRELLLRQLSGRSPPRRGKRYRPPGRPAARPGDRGRPSHDAKMRPGSPPEGIVPEVGPRTGCVSWFYRTNGRVCRIEAIESWKCPLRPDDLRGQPRPGHDPRRRIGREADGPADVRSIRRAQRFVADSNDPPDPEANRMATIRVPYPEIPSERSGPFEDGCRRLSWRKHGSI